MGDNEDSKERLDRIMREIQDGIRAAAPAFTQAVAEMGRVFALIGASHRERTAMGNAMAELIANGEVVIVMGNRPYEVVCADLDRALFDDACKSITLQADALYTVQEGSRVMAAAIESMQKARLEGMVYAERVAGPDYLHHDPTKRHRRRRDRKQSYTIGRKGRR